MAEDVRLSKKLSFRISLIMVISIFILFTGMIFAIVNTIKGVVKDSTYSMASMIIRVELMSFKTELIFMQMI